MSVLSGQTIRKYCKGPTGMIRPFEEQGHAFGLTYGLGPASYDVRFNKGYNSNDELVEDLALFPGGVCICNTIEGFRMPYNVCGTVHDKSTWARKLLVCQNTFIDPGWQGETLTLELTNHGKEIVRLRKGTPIAQIKFEFTDLHVERPYAGKYQNQGQDPVHAIIEAS